MGKVALSFLEKNVSLQSFAGKGFGSLVLLLSLF